MKEKFESILLQLKSNLKSDSVTSAFKTESDKKLYKELIYIIDEYHKNIDLFDKEKDSLQKLLINNASKLLDNTNSTSFNLYLPKYRNHANFLVDNYYKNEDINQTVNNLDSINNANMAEIEKSILTIRNTNLDELAKNVGNLKNTDLNNLQKNLDSIKNLDLQKLYNQLKRTNVNSDFLKSVENVKKLDLSLLQESLNAAKKLDLNKFEEDVKKIQNTEVSIDKKEFEKRYMKLVSLLNFPNKGESNFILYTKKEEKPFKLYKNSNDSIVIKAGKEASDMSFSLSKCISIIYEKEEPRFKSYTEVLFPKILDNSIFNELQNSTFIVGDDSVIGNETIIGKESTINKGSIGQAITDKIFDKHTHAVLNIKSVSKVFSKYIVKYNAEYTSTIIGIFAKWGRGKTFFYEQLKSDIQKENKKIYFCEFQPWKYQKQESAWAYLYEKVLNSYLENKETETSKRISSLELKLKNKFDRECWLDKIVHASINTLNLTNMWKIFLLNRTRIGISKVTFGLVSLLLIGLVVFSSIVFKIDFLMWLFGFLGVSGVIYSYKSYLFYMKSSNTIKSLIDNYAKTKDYSNYLGFQNEIEKELRYLINTYITEDDERLILFIDDLDRCDEKMIINIIDSLRLVLEDEEINKKLTVITALDERILLKSIKYKYFNEDNVGGNYEISPREYIEKFFLVALKLNQLNDSDKDELVNEYSSVFNNHSSSEKSKVIEDMQQSEMLNKEEKAIEDDKTSNTNENNSNDDDLEVLNNNEIKFIKKLIIQCNIDTPRKINIMIQRYLLFKNFIFEELGYENSNYELYISLIFYILEEEESQKPEDNKLKKLITLYNDSQNEEIEVEMYGKQFTLKKNRYIILVKYAEMVTPF